jgi:hypothetical protein
MTKPPLSLKRRLLRLFLWLAGIAVAFFTYSALLGWQTLYFSMARYTAHREPEVNVVPQPLIDGSISRAPGSILSYYGNTFEVPWKGMVMLKPVGKLKPAPNITNVKFASGQVLMIWAPTGSRGFLQEVAEDKTMGGAPMRALFAADIKAGPYQEESALLNATSDQVKFFSPVRVSARGAILVFMKAIAENPEVKTGIYAFQTPVVRGFQIGNPAHSPRVRLDFFDTNGNSLGEICLWYGKETSSRGTQADLNRIIQTFHPIANSSTSAPVSASATLTPAK